MLAHVFWSLKFVASLELGIWSLELAQISLRFMVGVQFRKELEATNMLLLTELAVAVTVVRLVQCTRGILQRAPSAVRRGIFVDARPSDNSSPSPP